MYGISVALASLRPVCETNHVRTSVALSLWACFAPTLPSYTARADLTTHTLDKAPPNVRHTPQGHHTIRHLAALPKYKYVSAAKYKQTQPYSGSQFSQLPGGRVCSCLQYEPLYEGPAQGDRETVRRQRSSLVPAPKCFEQRNLTSCHLTSKVCGEGVECMNAFSGQASWMPQVSQRWTIFRQRLPL